ncbi:hypothetical protein IG631_04530 [Alternaria alternata]|nr:hypothetical protein IG631_04530 [Alternaria alternata]
MIREVNSTTLTASPDFTTPVFVWSTVESALAVVSANLPFLGPLLPHKMQMASEIYNLFQNILPTPPESSSEESTAVESEEVDSIRSRLSFELRPPRPIEFPVRLVHPTEWIKMEAVINVLPPPSTSAMEMAMSHLSFPTLQWLQALTTSTRESSELSEISADSTETA